MTNRHSTRNRISALGQASDDYDVLQNKEMKPLTNHEKTYLADYVRKEDSRATLPRKLTYAGCAFIAACGLALIGSAVPLTLQSMTDYTVKWVLIPGTMSGAVLIAVSIYLMRIESKKWEKTRLIEILKKVAS